MKMRANRVLVGGIASAIAIAAAPPSFAGTLHNSWDYMIEVGDNSFLSTSWNYTIDAGYESLLSNSRKYIIDAGDYSFISNKWKYIIDVGDDAIRFLIEPRAAHSTSREPVYRVLPKSLITAILDFPCSVGQLPGASCADAGSDPCSGVPSSPEFCASLNQTMVYNSNVRVTPVPEPSAGLGVFTLAGLGIVARARRNK